jgi:hypothetical protein
MFARSCPRMGVRFASGNVFYMNQTFSARHLQTVSSPLSTGYISPVRFTGTNVSAAASSAIAMQGGGALDVATIASLAAGAGEGIADAFSTPANAELGAISTLFATMAKTPYTWGDQVTLTMKLDTQPHIMQDLHAHCAL